MLNKLVWIIVTLLLQTPLHAQSGCGGDGLWLQVLGSGGPELDDARASSGYVIWRKGKARILIDMGAGSLFRFEQSGAVIPDVDVMLLSHFHVDHSADLPAFIKASYFTDRKRNLLLYGPTGNHLMPSATDFVAALFGTRGAFRYLSDYLDGREGYRLLPRNVEANGKIQNVVLANQSYRLIAVPVHHGPIPALAWRVEIDGHSLVFSGDMSNSNNTLTALAKNADILIAHHAIAEESNPVARQLHMPPSVIGQIAAKAGVKKLVLSHRMNRTLGQEKNSTKQIQQFYRGPMVFADDLQCFKL